VGLAHSLEASSCSATQFPELYQIHDIYLYTEASRAKSISHTKVLLKHSGDIAGYILKMEPKYVFTLKIWLHHSTDIIEVSLPYKWMTTESPSLHMLHVSCKKIKLIFLDLL
jgi:hypothetical protein